MSTFRIIPSTTIIIIETTILVKLSWKNMKMTDMELITTWESIQHSHMKTAIEIGFSNYGQGFYDDVFETDTEWY